MLNKLKIETENKIEKEELVRIKDGESVAVLYQPLPLTVEEKEKAYIFNSTGEDGIFIEVRSDREYELYDIFGASYENGTLHSGVNRVPVQNCGMIYIKQN